MIDGTAQWLGDCGGRDEVGERLRFPLNWLGWASGTASSKPIGLPEWVVMVTNDRTVSYESANERGRLFYRTSEQ